MSITIGDAYTIYGWDSAFALLYALDTYDKMYNLSNILDETIGNVTERLLNIMSNDSFWFYGITGNVSFNDGNRRNGLYALGNIIDNDGSINYFGVWTDSLNVTNDDEYDKCDECATSITWPDQFTERGLIPRSSKLITYQIVTLDDGVRYCIFVLCIISILIVISSIVLQWRWRNNVIIKASSWKLNVLTCTGCLLAHFTVIIYGWPPTNVWCNIREWLLTVSFTLVFMPLFMKTYRVSVIFTSLTVKTLSDFRLVIGVISCLFIDTMILMVFTIIEIEQTVAVNGNIRSVHALNDIQEQYIVCIKNETQNDLYNVVFLIVMCVWKGIQLSFGLIVALIVSRIGLDYVQKFNETNSQIFAIIFTIVMIVAMAIPVLFQQVKDPNGFYWILGIASLLITNVVLGANVLPRLWAVFNGNEDKFKLNQQDIVKAAIKGTFRNRTKQSLMNMIYEAELINLHHTPQARNILSTNGSD